MPTPKLKRPRAEYNNDIECAIKDVQMEAFPLSWWLQKSIVSQTLLYMHISMDEVYYFLATSTA
jgi:hypothetical protein